MNYKTITNQKSKLIKQSSQSDTATLGTLVQFRHFRHFKINLFLQNEPKFQNGTMDTTLYIIRDYENLRTFRRRKNEPKTNPNEPKLFKNLTFVSSCKSEAYKMNPHFCLKNPEAKTNPNLLRIQSNISYGKLGSYETDLGFWPKNPKANFLQNLATVSSCKRKGYGNEPLFLA